MFFDHFARLVRCPCHHKNDLIALFSTNNLFTTHHTPYKKPQILFLTLGKGQMAGEKGGRGRPKVVKTRRPKLMVSSPMKREFIGAVRAGTTNKELIEIFGVKERQIYKLIEKYREDGHFRFRPGQGRKRKTTARDDKLIIREVVRDRFITGNDILKRQPHLKVSARTVRRRITESGKFASYWAANKPYICERNRKKRLAWAKDHLNWSKEQWHRVLWTDESPYVLRFKAKKRVWRMHNERYKPECTVATVKHDKKIMVWGGFAAHGVGKLYRVKGILEQLQYTEMLETQVIPSAAMLFPGGDYIFQQDNDPKHTSKRAKKYVIDNNIPTMEWPAQSPDLNPIENLWSILDRQLAYRQVNSEDQLFAALQEGWNDLDPAMLERLVDTMPERCQAVIDSRGFATKW